MTDNAHIELKPTIMIVDDQPMIEKFLMWFLGKQNYGVIFFTNGKKALAYLKSNTVSLLLTDMEMPEITGLESHNR